ncbi:MAG: aldo/keto reductase [Pseudomonadaceae bacterium]|nr:aldo/keto reductase [Pseudomonadaceae bacterium]
MRRNLGSSEVTAVGLGCMNLSHGYGPGLEHADGVRFLQEALDLGYDFYDTASLYGDGRNESLIGEAISHRRDEFFLASKCVLGLDGEKRVLDGRPESIKRMCDDSLKRLNTDHIDLYYMHRLDRKVPIEDSVGAMAELVAAGKIGNVGLSEMSAETLRRACAVHPIKAMQSEYSLWTRNPELGVLDACAELDVTFVAFSPVGRGFLSDVPPAEASNLHEHDIRRTMPRFEAPRYEKNLALLEMAAEMAAAHNATVAQVALAWVLSRGDHIVTIPGTTHRQHLKDNLGAVTVHLPEDALDQLTAHFAPERIEGSRYSAAAQRTVDTERFDFELAESDSA